MRETAAFRLLFLCSFCLFPLFNSLADSGCSTINLEDNGKSMSHVPVLDQGSAGYCYAYAAAELMDAWRFSHGDVRYHQHVSPIPLAMQQGLAISKEIHAPETSDYSVRFGENGKTCPVINSIPKKPRSVCTSEGVHDRYRGNSISTERAIRQDILPEDYLNNEENGPATSQFLGYLDDLFATERYRYQRSALSSCGVEDVKRQLQILDFGSLAPTTKVLKTLLNQDDPVLFVDGVVTVGCTNPKNRIELPEFSCESMNRGCYDEKKPGCGDPAPLIREIDKRLGMENAQPIAVGIDSSIFFNTDPSSQDPGKKMNANHVALVVGRRKVGNSCQYLIRNSHGENCPDSGGCVAGDIWLDEALLRRSLFELNWLN
jgi:hypothetical protein